jgi:hypothetical protein
MFASAVDEPEDEGEAPTADWNGGVRKDKVGVTCTAQHLVMSQLNF